jgi:flagellar biosynthesis protein FliP
LQPICSEERELNDNLKLGVIDKLPFLVIDIVCKLLIISIIENVIVSPR